jgi:O-antigen/teichoic acid export membrane protein
LGAATSQGAAAAVVGFLTNVLLLPWVLGSVGADTYGGWAGIAAILAVLTLTDVGFRTEVVRRVATAHGMESPADATRSARVGLTLTILASAPIFLAAVVAAPQITGFLFPRSEPTAPPDTILLVRLMVTWTWVTVVCNAFLAALKGLQRSDVEARAQIVAVPLSAATTVLCIRGGADLWSFGAALVVSTAVPLAAQWVSLRRLAPHIVPRPARTSRAEVSSFVGLAGLAALSQVTEILDSQWDKLVVAHLVGPEAVASLHIGTSIALQGKVVALLPLLPLMVAVAELRRSFPMAAVDVQRGLMRSGAVMAAITTGALFVFGPSYIELWLGNDAGAAGDVARWFAVAVALNLVSAPVAFQAIAEGHHRLAAAGSLANGLSNAVASLVLTLHLGVLGAVYGSIIGNAIGSALFLVLARRHLTVWVSPPLAPPFVASLVVACLTLTGLDRFASWEIGVLVAAPIGAAVLWILFQLRRMDIGDEPQPRK